MKRVLITGTTGLVGDGISRYFLKNNWIVFGTSRQNIKSLHPNFTPLKLELGSKKDLGIVCGHLPFDAVIHCAAKLPHSLLNDEDIDKCYRCNVNGTRYLLDWARLSKIKKFIYISSTGCLSDEYDSYYEKKSIIAPKSNHYHVSKAMGEMLCSMYNVQGVGVVTLRISAPYGYVNNQSVIPKFIKLAEQNQNIELWGSGSRAQSFTFVEDIGYACALAISNEKANGIYYIAGNQLTTMHELAKAVIHAIPKTKSEIVFPGIEDPSENQKNNIAIEKAEHEMNYSPQFSLSEGLRKIVKKNKTPFWVYK